MESPHPSHTNLRMAWHGSGVEGLGQAAGWVCFFLCRCLGREGACKSRVVHEGGGGGGEEVGVAGAGEERNDGAARPAGQQWGLRVQAWAATAENRQRRN